MGQEKGEAVEHLVQMMKEEGDKSLGNLQGYEQTYNDGARRFVYFIFIFKMLLQTYR